MTVGLVSVVGPSSPLQTQRNLINMNLLNDSWEFPYINHVINGFSGGPGPINSFYTGTVWAAQIDANGYGNAGVAGWGDGFVLPGPNKYTDIYILEWTGDGEISISTTFGFTEAADGTHGQTFSTTYTKTATNQYKNKAGQTAFIGLTFTTNPNGNDVDTTMGYTWVSTGPTTPATNLRLYRWADRADLLAGNTFRAGWKQSFVDLNPAAIRFMNWAGGNGSPDIRFENRSLPGRTILGNFTTSPVYQNEFTGTNQFTLAAATPTAANPKTTPASMQHGEVVVARSSSTTQNVRCTNTGPIGGCSIASIEKAALSTGHPLVTTNGAHGFNTGDKIVHYYISTMSQLQFVPCTITSQSSTSYSIDVDTSGYSAFVSATDPNALASQFTTLQVGSGNDRTAYPIIFTRGDQYISLAGGNLVVPSKYNTFAFTKNITLQYDANGTPRPGAWIWFGQYQGLPQDVPLEYCVALINELNAMLPNGRAPINMYWNIPFMGMNSTDPDYSAASNFAVKAMDVILNGANGFTGLVAGSPRSTVFVEYSNETWNPTPLSAFLERQGLQQFGTADTNLYSSYRMVKCFQDLQAAYPSNPKIKYMLGLSGFGGSTPGTQNGFRILGASSGYPAATTAWAGTGLGQPISYCDAAVFAPYVATDGSVYYSNTGLNTLADDCAMYVGADNSGTLSMTGGTGASFTATFTASNASIAGTNTFAAGAIVQFAATVGNVLTNTNYYILATGLSGTTFQISLSSGGTVVTPSTNGSATATPCSITLTITAVASQTPVVNQMLVGTGISAGTWITAVSGSGQNWTLTLNQNATVANGTTNIKAPSNGGGNYIGAANPTLAVTHFVNQESNGYLGAGTDGSCLAWYQNFLTQLAANLIPVGKYLCQYEGGMQWHTNQWPGFPAGYPLLALDAANSAQWGTNQVQLWKNCSLTSTKITMPALYLALPNQSTTDQIWGYSIPDSYAKVGGIWTEGQGLKNNGTWAAASARNQALPL